MRRGLILLLAVIAQVGVFAQQYFPEGTKWTEIRLDTLKYDSWYSKVGGEWIPNFETVDYYVNGEYKDKTLDYWTFRRVYTSSENWTDSLTMLISEGEFGVEVDVANFYENQLSLQPAAFYQLEWEAGTMIEFKDIISANCDCIFPPDKFDFGVVEDIQVGDFGGVRPLKYSDVNGVRLVQGIGVTNWNDGECIFGPLRPYEALEYGEKRNYRSMLVHFERNGEVLYDLWPSTNGMMSVRSIDTIISSSNYDLSGRKLLDTPHRGLYIRSGKKVIR